MDFVVGHPRSGTALLAAILNAGGPPVAEHEWLAKLARESISAATEYYERRRTRDSIAALLRRYPQSSTIRIDSNWKLAWMLDVALEELPEARVLHLARHPRENVAACLSLDFYGDPARRLPDLQVRNEWLDAMPRIDRPDWERLSQFEKNCAFWAETHRLILRATADHPRVMRVRLEELDIATAHRVRAFFGLARVDDERLARVLEAKHNDRVAIRARLAAAGAPSGLPADGAAREAFETLTRDIAAALGYAPSPSV
jgi:hypothetical protein